MITAQKLSKWTKEGLIDLVLPFGRDEDRDFFALEALGDLDDFLLSTPADAPPDEAPESDLPLVAVCVGFTTAPVT